MIVQALKDDKQKNIEYVACAMWLIFCVVSILIKGLVFAEGVFVGGAVCIVNYYWLYSHARRAINLPPHKSASFMIRRYIFRLAAIAFVLFALIKWAQINVFALIIGLSVVLVSITGYTLYTYIFAGGE